MYIVKQILHLIIVADIGLPTTSRDNKRAFKVQNEDVPNIMKNMIGLILIQLTWVMNHQWKMHLVTLVKGKGFSFGLEFNIKLKMAALLKSVKFNIETNV